MVYSKNIFYNAYFGFIFPLNEQFEKCNRFPFAYKSSFFVVRVVRLISQIENLVTHWLAASPAATLK